MINLSKGRFFKEKEKLNFTVTKNNYRDTEKIIKLIFRALIPIILLLSGLTLLALRIAGWSLIFGLPITIFGTVFLIYTYDEVISRRVGTISDKFTDCSICGKKTPLIVGADSEETICPVCRTKKG